MIIIYTANTERSPNISKTLKIMYILQEADTNFNEFTI